MRLGISTASFFNKVLTENCFSYLREMGVSNTEVFYSSYYETDTAFAGALYQKAGEINIHSVHALSVQFEGQLFSKAKRVFDDAEIYFRRALAGGQSMHARNYTFHGPIDLVRSADGMSPEKYADILNKLSDIANFYGIYLCQENVHYCFPNNPKFMKVIYDRCPNVRFTLDVKHALLSDYQPQDFLDVMGDRLATVHVTDFANGKTAMPGKGKFNFKNLFRELDKIPTNPVVLIEAYGRDFENISELEDSYRYLKDIAKEI